jgi:hypothetical protein
MRWVFAHREIPFYRNPLQNEEMFVPVNARLKYFTAFLGRNADNIGGKPSRNFDISDRTSII